jgi:hypothetical protein
MSAAGSCATPAAWAEAGHSLSTAACLVVVLTLGHAHPYKAVVDSYWGTSDCTRMRSEDLSGMESAIRDACCRRWTRRTTCWNRKTDWRRKQH